MTLLVDALGGLLSFLLLYKYVALFVIGYVAALALPIPASTTLVAAGAFASQGYFDLSSVLLVAFVANISGDASGYLLAKRYGDRVLVALGLGRVLSSRAFRALEGHMRRFPQAVIFITRFMTEVGPATSVLSGLTRVPSRTFFLYACLGEIAYVLLFGLSGYYLGGEWENNLAFLAKGAMLVVSLGVAFNTIQWTLYKRKSGS
jgi:membrane protein DedA with SNARE-associated domain